MTKFMYGLICKERYENKAKSPRPGTTLLLQVLKTLAPS